MASTWTTGYSADEVTAALLAGRRSWRFRYDLLNKDGLKIGEIDTMKTARVSVNYLASIKATANFELEDTGQINFLTDMIQPNAGLVMPDGGIVWWPMGVYILSTPPRQPTRSATIQRKVDAYDQSVILQQDKITDRYTSASGANYIAEVKNQLDLAGIVSYNLTPTSSTLPAARDWPPGTSRLQIVNDLLGAINYRALYFDMAGQAVAEPYVSPADRASEWTYINDDKSVIVADSVSDAMDLYGVPNQWDLVVSLPDQSLLTSSYTNTNPDSPTSTVSRGRTITDYRQATAAADQATLDAKVQRLAFEASQVYREVTMETGLMPFHGINDVVTLHHSTLDVDDTFSQISWSATLAPGGKMKHKIRRVVSV